MKPENVEMAAFATAMVPPVMIGALAGAVLKTAFGRSPWYVRMGVVFIATPIVGALGGKVAEATFSKSRGWFQSL